MTLDSVSEAVLAPLHPSLVARVRRAAEALGAKGIYFRVYSGFRNSQEQDADYAKGRTAPGPRVTDAKAGESSHNYGLAIDAAPFVSGSTGALNWNASSPQFQAMVAAMLDAGLKWGGNWHAMDGGDKLHFYIGPDTPNPEMLVAYNRGDTIRSIWMMPGIDLDGSDGSSRKVADV